MFDIKQAYIQAFTALEELKLSQEKNQAVLQSYESLLNVISNDPRFRALTYMEANQTKD